MNLPLANKSLFTILFTLYLVLNFEQTKTKDDLLNEVYLKVSSQLLNIGPHDVPKMSPSNVSRAFPKNPMRSSRPEMTSRGHANLMFKGRPWEVDSRRHQDVLRTSPRGSSMDVLGRCWVISWISQNLFLLFFQKLFN